MLSESHSIIDGGLLKGSPVQIFKQNAHMISVIFYYYFFFRSLKSLIQQHLSGFEDYIAVAEAILVYRRHPFER